MTEIKKCEFCGRSEMETAMGFNNGKGICLNCSLMIANRFEVFSKTKGTVKSLLTVTFFSCVS